VRPAPLTEFFDDALKFFYAEASYLASKVKEHEAMRIDMAFADPVFREFELYGMKIVVVDPKHRGAKIRAYVEFIERAHKDIKRKGFGVVWYGVLFLMSSDYEKLSKEEQAGYERAGYAAMERRAGTYHSGNDVVRITAPANDDLVRTIVHELGHRYWFKIMSKGERARFESLIEGDWSMLHALLLNQERLDRKDGTTFLSGYGYANELAHVNRLFEKAEVGKDLTVAEKDFVRQRFEKLGLQAGVPLVSTYARSRPTEAFAEVFERYVVERDMTRAQVESFRSVLPRGKGGGGAKIRVRPRAEQTRRTQRGQRSGGT
jgi:GNAT superfamily N-acetyltransferase